MSGISLMRRVVSVWLVVVLSSVGAWGQPTGRDINPGLLGFNALSPFETTGPWVGERWLVAFGAGLQLSSPESGADVSYTVPFRFEYPFVKRASLWLEGSPFEAFTYTRATQLAWSPNRPAGVTRGDISFGSRFLVYSGTGWFPAIGVRVLVKTATGENLANRRFLDAPAYQLDFLFGERLEVLGGELELAVCLGFLAWQQGEAGQNDAFAGSGRARWEWGRLAARVEVRGYSGWQHNDRPLVGLVGLEWRFTEALQVEASATRSFRDPPGLDFRIGVKLSGPTLKMP